MTRLLVLIILAGTLSLSVQARAQSPSPVNIPIQNIPQETPVWCWAAVAQQIILASRGSANTPPQCALVALAYGFHPAQCCGGYNPECLRTGSLLQIQGLIQRFGGRWTAVAPPTSPQILYQTLRSGRPIILQVSTGVVSSHVVVLRGMSFFQTPFGLEPVLHINDPLAFFTQPVPFSRLVGFWQAGIVVN